MIVTVYSSKGGVGKTPIAANILFDHEDWYVATNELDSGFGYIESISEERKLLINPEDEFNEEVFTKGEFAESGANMVIDLSGSIAESIKSIPSALNISDVVVVPINDQSNSIIQGIRTIQNIHEYFPKLKIVVAATKLDRQGIKDIFGDDWSKSESFKKIKDFVDGAIGLKIDVVPLKFSKGYENMMKEEASLRQLASVPFGGHHYKVPASQFDELYKAIGVK